MSIIEPAATLAPSEVAEVLTSGDYGLALVIVVGALIIGTTWVARQLLAFLPLSRARRDAMARATPVLAGVAGLAYTLWAARVLLESYPAYVPFALTGIIAAFVFASWFAIRDVINGIFLKAGRVCTVGDYVRVGDVHGRVESMGLRVMAIETSTGNEAILPYSAIARGSVLRTPVTESASLHVFTLHLPKGLTVVDAKLRIRRAALQCHWSTLTREPEVVLAEDNTFEVTVFSLHADHGPDIEAFVREALDAAAAPR